MRVKLDAEFSKTEILTNGKIQDKKKLAGAGFAHFDRQDMDCL